MKRYLLFAGDTYYPGGGWTDFIGSFDSIDDAIAATGHVQHDWWHVVDATTGKEVA